MPENTDNQEPPNSGSDAANLLKVPMTDQEKRIKIAEFCGYKRLGNGVYCDFWPNSEYTTGAEMGVLMMDPKQSGHAVSPPDYLNDLNAMHEAEQMLRPEDLSHARTPFSLYCFALAEIVGTRIVGYFARATASQRADAFLKAADTFNSVLNGPPSHRTNSEPK